MTMAEDKQRNKLLAHHRQLIVQDTKHHRSIAKVI
jgi:hypothetical protein